MICYYYLKTCNFKNIFKNLYLRTHNRSLIALRKLYDSHIYMYTHLEVQCLIQTQILDFRSSRGIEEKHLLGAFHCCLQIC